MLSDSSFRRQEQPLFNQLPGEKGVNSIDCHFNYSALTGDVTVTTPPAGDVGFGYGWRLLAGSITPYMYGYFGIYHYVFTDSTGAEYRLDNCFVRWLWVSLAQEAAKGNAHPFLQAGVYARNSNVLFRC